MQGSSGNRSAFLRNAGLVIFVLAFTAFALKAIVHPVRLARYTPIVITHGLLMLGWLALFVGQARLITNGDTQRHTSIGKMSWLLPLLIVCTSILISYSLFLEFRVSTVFIGNMYMLAAFTGFYLVAIRSIRAKDVESHKRYMLFATLSLLVPAFGRFSEVFFGNKEISLLMFLVFVIALPLIFDRSTGRRFHKATIIGIAASIAWVALMIATIASPVGPMLMERVG